MKPKFVRYGILAGLILATAGCEIMYWDDMPYHDGDDGRTTDPSLLAITTPDSRDSYDAGQTMAIRWDGDAQPESLTLELHLAGEPIRTLAEGIANRGGFDWTIPNDFAVNSEIINEYQVVARGYHPDYSRKLQLVAYSDQFTIVPTSTGGLSDVEVNTRFVEITLIDDGSQIDNDTIDIHLNGALIAAEHVLEESPGSVFSVELQSGENIFEIYAVDEGNVPPNTALLQISNVVVGESTQQWRLLTGEWGRLTIEAP